jgi:DNA modification methylase
MDGWGGRVIGFMLSHANKYLGIDVSDLQSSGVSDIVQRFNKYVNKDITLECESFDNIKLDNNSFDFAITSPPYFDTEKYIGGDQSYIKYKTYSEWKDGFYYNLIHKVYMSLKENCFFALQIGSQRYELLKDGKEIARKIGFTYIETIDTDMINNQMKTEKEIGEVVIILKK